MWLRKQFGGKQTRTDVDIKVADMNPEEKAVFDCLDVGCDDEEADEIGGGIDDDFIALLNEGMPALELVTKEDKEKQEKPAGSAAQANKDTVIVKDDGQGGAHPMMIENYKERMADVLAMLDAQKDFKDKEAAQGKRQDHVEMGAKSLVD